MVAAKLRLGHLPTLRSLGGSDDEAARIHPSGYLVRARAHGRTAALCRPLMTTAADTASRSSTALSMVSISDYEALIAPRGAFVDFLVGPFPAASRPEILDTPALTA